jgi:hypothetical protein
MVMPQPPPPLPRRRNGFLRLFDLPIYRDWIAWLTLFWAIVAPVAVTSEPSTDSNTPRWADALLAMVVFVLLLGVLPAYVRLLYRRFRWQRRNGRQSQRQLPDMPAVPPAQLTPFIAAQPPPLANTPASQGAASAAPPAPSAPRSERPVPWVSPPPPSGPPMTPAAFEHSDILKSARKDLQFPIARCAREVILSSDFRQQYDAILRAADALTMTLGISIAAALRVQGGAISGLEALRSAYFGRGVSLGHWNAVIRAAAKPIPGLSEPLPGMLDALRQGKGGTGLVPALDALVEERNRWAHGAGPRNNVEAGVRINDRLGPALEDALAKVEFLHRCPWVLVVSSSYRRSQQQFDITAADVMADHPDFERRHFLSSVPLADDVVYMMTPGGPIDLTPFVVMRDCPECQQSELCYADRVYEQRGVSLKSFARGHIMYDNTLVAEMQTLFASA